LVRGELLSGSGNLSWDGKWNDGETGKMGAYIVHLEAISEYDGEKYTAKAVVYLGKRL
jgi:flagellar hook assembly protein FlgD